MNRMSCADTVPGSICDNLHILIVRFRTFEANQKELMEMVEFWDRTSLTIKRPRTPSERSDEDGHLQHPPSGKKGKGKGKVNQLCWVLNH